MDTENDSLDKLKEELHEKEILLKQSHDNISLLSTIGQEITSSLELGEVVSAVYSHLKELLECDVFGIGLVCDDDTLIFEGIVEQGDKLPPVTFGMDDSTRLSVRTIQCQEEINIGDWGADHELFSDERPENVHGLNIRSIAYLPITVQKNKIGVVTVQSLKKHAYKEHQMSLMRNLSIYIAIALEKMQAFKKMQELLNEQDSLMSVVAHDLKSPLNKIQGVLSLMKLSGDLNEEQAIYMGMANDIVQQGKDQIRDILDVNSVGHSSSQVQINHFDLNGLIGDSIRSFKETSEKKEIDIHWEEVEGLQIDSDPKFINRILDNLISNAIKFSDSGANVWVSATPENGSVKISVKDEGPGISKEDQPFMFKKFQRLSAKPTGGESSTGLGLSIIKTLVERLEGTIEFESELDIGTTFTVTLPTNNNGSEAEPEN